MELWQEVGEILLPYFIYACTIAIAVALSWRQGAREGLEIGVEMTLMRLARDGIISIILDKDGEIDDIKPVQKQPTIKEKITKNLK